MFEVVAMFEVGVLFEAGGVYCVVLKLLSRLRLEICVRLWF